jgi:hypothetical protein
VIEGDHRNAKVLTLIARKVNESAIGKNTKIIRPHNPDSDIGGSVSVYTPRMRIWANASAYMTKWAIWVDKIRLYSQKTEI